MLGLIGVFVLVILGLNGLGDNAGFTGNVVLDSSANNTINDSTNDSINDSGEKHITFSFFDLVSNCSLDGDVYVDRNYLGKTRGGVLYLNEFDYGSVGTGDVIYVSLGNSTLSINGLTGECFGYTRNFSGSVEIDDLQNFFDRNQNVSFGVRI